MDNSLNVIQKKKNYSIDLMRIICSYMVCAIHIHPGRDISETLFLIVSSVIAYIGVPFFFAVSGYFYIRSMEQGRSNFKKYIIRLLKIYVFWSLIYFAFQAAYSTYTHTFELKPFLLHCLRTFFIDGSYYQLWFFPAVFIAVILSTIANKLKLLKQFAYFSIILYVLGLCVTSYYGIVKDTVVVDWLFNNTDTRILRRMFFMNIPFFMMGYFIYKFRLRFNIKQNKAVIALIMFLLLYFVEVYLVYTSGTSKSFILTIFIYFVIFTLMILLLENPIKHQFKHGDKFRKISSFIYLSHPLFIPFIRDYFDLTQTPLYIIIVVLLTAIGFGVSTIKWKFIDEIL